MSFIPRKICFIAVWVLLGSHTYAQTVTETSCGNTVTYPVDGCASCSSPVTIINNDYTIAGNNQTICLNASTINTLTISGSGNIIRICGNTTIGNVSTNLGGNNTVLNTSGATLNFPGAILSTGTQLTLVNYGILNIADPANNISSKTFINVGSAASINIASDLTFNGNISMFMLGGMLNVNGMFTLNNASICLNHNAGISVKSITVNTANAVSVDASSASCFRYTENATVYNGVPLTSSVITICRGPGANVPEGSWGPSATVIDNCTSCAPSGKPDFVIKNVTDKICTDPVSGNTITLTVANEGTDKSTAGQTITASAVISPQLSVVNISAAGWTTSRSGQTYTFTRTDELDAGASYPQIVLSVESDFGTTSVTTAATVSYTGAEMVVNNNTSSSVFYPTPAPPAVVTPVVYCQSATAVPLTATGSNLMWYDIPSGGAGVSTAPVPGTSVAGTTRYYVSQNTGNCEGSRATITVIVTPLPAAPIGPSGQAFCQSQSPTVASLQASGIGIRWYANATGGAALPLSQPLVSGSVYYAGQTIGGCESGNRLAVTVTVSIVAAPTGNAVQDFCAASDPVVASLQANGSNIKWYAAASGGTALPGSLALLPGATYYAAQTIDGCESTGRLAVRVNIFPVPSAASAGPDQLQYNSDVFTLAGNIPVTGTGQWSVVSGTAVIDDVTLPGTTATLAPNSTAVLRWAIGSGVCAASADEVVLSCQRSADLNIVLTDGSITYTPGTQNTYLIIVKNHGPSDVSRITVTSLLPQGIFSSTWVASTQNGASVPNTGGTGSIQEQVNMPSGSTITYRVTWDVPSSFRGNLVNTATILLLGSDFGDIDLDNNSSIDTDIPNFQYGIQAVQAGPANIIAGAPIEYRLLVTNTGPSDLANASIQDVFPAGIDNITWTVTAQGNATVNTSGGSGDLSFQANLPAGSDNAVTVVVRGTVRSSVSGTLVNTATVTPPARPPLSSNTITTVVRTVTGLQVIKSGPLSGSVQAGRPILYTIAVTNSGPSDAVDLVITDHVPAAITGVVWDAAGQGNATVSASSGSGNTIQLQGTIPAGAGNTILIHINGVVASSATGTITNTVTVTPSGGTEVTAACGTAVVNKAAFSINKTGPAHATAGTPIVYSVVIENTGPSDASGVVISDMVDPSVEHVSWSATATGAASIASGASGTGNTVNVQGTAPAGSGFVVWISGIVHPAYTGILGNSASVTADQQSPVQSAVVQTTVTGRSSLRIVKTAPAALSAGSPVTYSIGIGNDGPSDASDIQVTDTLPIPVTNIVWSASVSGAALISDGATGNGRFVNIKGNLPAGSGNTILVTVTGIIDASYAGVLTNTAYVKHAGNVAAASQAETAVALSPAVRITKSGPSSLEAGQTIVYAIRAMNEGPSDAKNAVITDTLPPQIAGVSWTTVASGNVTITGGATGSGNIIHVRSDIPASPSDEILVTITGVVSPAYTGALTNTAHVISDGQSDRSVSQVTTDIFHTSNLSIVKSGPPGIIAGATIVYTLAASNAGPSDAQGILITDTLPAQIGNVSWTATASDGAVIGTGNAGSGNILSVTGSIPAGDDNGITVTITGTVNAAYSGVLTNTGYVAAAGISTIASSPVVTSVSVRPSVHITKSGPSTIAAGELVSYVIKAGNGGPSDALNVLLTDTLPAQISDAVWTATGSGGAVISTGNAGSGNIISVTGTIPAGSTNEITIAIQGTVHAAYTGLLTNTAYAVADQQSKTASSPAVTFVKNLAQLHIDKAGPPSVSAGSTVAYRIGLINTGPSDAPGIIIGDIIPAQITGVSWTASVSGTAVINSGATGSGNIIQVNADIPGTGTDAVIITVTGTVLASAAGTISNTATAVYGGITVTSEAVTTTISKVANLVIQKSGPSAIIAGQPVVYTVIAGNTGPSDAGIVTITDIVPATIRDITWTVVANGSASLSGTSSGTGNNISVSGTIPPGIANTILITIDGMVDPSAPAGTLTNTATAIPGPGVSDPGSATATVTTSVSRAADLKIIQSGPADIAVNQPVTYTLVITNDGPSNITGASVTDIIPAQIGNLSFSISSTGSAGGSGSFTGNTFNGSVDLSAGINDTVTITIQGTALAAATISNTATIAPPAGVSELNNDDNSSTVTTSVTNDVGILISKMGPAAVNAGGRILYVIRVANNGATDAAGVTITDNIPAVITGVIWNVSISGSGGTTVNALSGTGNTISLNADIEGTTNGPGEITIIVSGTVASSASGVITNTAVADFGGVKQSTRVTMVNNASSLRIIKSGPAHVYAGQTILYTIDVTNAGPSDAAGISISDIIPAQLQDVSWTAAATGSAGITTGATGTGNTLTVTGNLPAGTGNRIRVMITGTVNAAYTGTLTNTASAAAPGNTVVSVPVVTQVSKHVRLHVSKAGPPIYTAGSVLHYTIDVTNKGLSDATGITISDLVPATLQQVSWTATAFAGAIVTAGSGGTGNTVSVTGDIPAGNDNGLRIQVSGRIDASYAGTISNTASAAAPGDAVVVSPEVITRVIPVALLHVNLSGPAAVHAGQTIVYTIDVTNRGPSDAISMRIANVIPDEIQDVSWTAVALGSGATITAGQTGAGNNVSLTGNLAAGPGNRIRIAITGKVDPSYTGTLISLAGARIPGNLPVLSFPILTTVSRQVSMHILKAGAAIVSAGGKMTYALEITNTGPSDAEHMAITDILPVQLQKVSWTASVTGSGTITAGQSGTGNHVHVLANLDAGASNRIRILITGTVDPSYSGSISNTASVTTPGDAPAVSGTVTTQVINLVTLRMTLSGPQLASAGQSITYTLDVRNNGPSNATGITVSDMVPSQLQHVKWIATASGSSAVTGGMTGSGNTVHVSGNITAGEGNYIRVVITGIADKSFTGTIVNNAVASAPGNLPVVSGAVRTQVIRVVSLGTVKTGPASVIAGQSMSYRVEVVNTGSADAVGIHIADLVSVQLRNVTWKASAAGNSTVTAGAAGTGNTVSVTGNIEAGTGNSIQVTINGVTDPAYTGNISNSVIITAPGSLPIVSSPVVTNVSKQVNIELQKTGPPAIKAGERISYSITAFKSGASDAGAVSITDIVPATIINTSWKAAAYGSAAIQGAANGTGNTVDLTASIPGGSANSVQVDISGIVDPGFAGAIRNTATATLQDATVYSSDTIATTVNRSADMSIEKAAPLLVFDGNRIRWRIRLSNKGPSAAGAVVAADTLPALLTDAEVRVIQATAGIAGLSATVTGNLVIISAADFQAGNSCLIDILATVRPGSSGLLVNTASVKGTNTDPDPDNNSVLFATYVVPRTKLDISKTVQTASPYAVGQRIRYAITVSNNGIPDVRDMEVTDKLPPLTQTGVPAIQPPPAGTTAVYNAADNTITWKADMLRAGTSLQLLYDVDITDSGDVINTAYVKGDTLVSLPDTVITTIRSDYLANLAIDKKLLSTPPYSVGKDIRFSIAVINNGPNTAHGVTVTDLLAANLDLVKDIVLTNGTANYTPATNTLVWNIGTLAPGEQDTLLFSVRLRSGGNIANTATIQGNEKDPNMANNTSSITAVAIGEDDIWIPTAITPNGDGRNDRFVILGLNRYPGSDLVIYNRWDSQVYHSSSYANDWDAKGLAQGTYYYVLKINRPSGIEVRKGWVMVLK